MTTLVLAVPGTVTGAAALAIGWAHPTGQYNLVARVVGVPRCMAGPPTTCVRHRPQCTVYAWSVCAGAVVLLSNTWHGLAVTPSRTQFSASDKTLWLKQLCNCCKAGTAQLIGHVGKMMSAAADRAQPAAVTSRHTAAMSHGIASCKLACEAHIDSSLTPTPGLHELSSEAPLHPRLQALPRRPCDTKVLAQQPLKWMTDTRRLSCGIRQPEATHAGGILVVCPPQWMELHPASVEQTSSHTVNPGTLNTH